MNKFVIKLSKDKSNETVAILKLDDQQITSHKKIKMDTCYESSKTENKLTTASNTISKNTMSMEDESLDTLHVESPNKSTLSKPIIDTNRDPCQGKENAYYLLSNGFGPYQPKNYDFPKRGGRKFRSEWFISFPWLEYSPSKDSAYCFYCRAFPSNKSDITFISEGFRQWSKACFKSFPKHEQSVPHKESITKIAGYNEAKKSGSIINKVNTQYNQEVAENREYLKCVLETLLFCARQGIAIRGHRENEESQNKGNFQELLNLRSRDNDIIRRYFTEKEKNFRYVSGEYLNEFLGYMANIVIRDIVDNVLIANIFSIIVDETQDLSRHEQVAIILRYVNNDFSPIEAFLGFYKVESTDGLTLSLLIKNVLISNGLQLECLRGQCYDGAASMRGAYKGVQSRIKEENPLALYVHCNAHILNLCLVDLSKQISHVRNVFGTLSTLHNFINASSKRQAVFDNMRSKLNMKMGDGPSTLKSLSDTRWSCRIDALESLIFNYQVVIDSLENISENDSIHGSDANSLLKSMKTFEFLFCVHFFRDIMSITNILSKYLQSSNIDYSSVQHMTKATIQELSNMRCEDKFDMIWSKANVMRIDNEICSPILSRKSKVPKKLGGGLKQNENCNVKDHYKINIYFQVLDTIISDMKERFKENDIHILNCMQDIIVNEPIKFTSFQDVSTMYGFNESELKAETKIFNRMYKSLNTENTIQSKIKYMRSGDNAIGFPTLAKLYKLFLTIPSNSAACERSFSCLRRLKNYLRSTMGQSRLNHLGILQIERERSLNINNDEVIKQFDSSTIPRRLKFNNF
ncbi:zinc finger MYM-type protein 1-like [Myzus persicae]|uniref:zinc finger MYM-type protein 1-like n=1 Tax=Myzus persicae TaxID=13164 RepID=UPI000B939A6B|nr:zinc finger MYM-type protein 1-like [Myzus persicae]